MTANKESLNVTTQRFNFDPERDHSQSKARVQAKLLLNLTNRKSQEKEKPLFVVNKKSNSIIVNNKSSYSKDVVKLSHGDQYRSIFQITNVLNNSAGNHNAGLQVNHIDPPQPLASPITLANNNVLKVRVSP